MLTSLYSVRWDAKRPDERNDMKALNDLLQQAIELTDRGENDEAIRVYESILSQNDDFFEAHFNLGLIYKYRGDWIKSFDHNKRATEIDPAFEGAHWNLGIAATMLKRWLVARACWNHFGAKHELVDEDPAGNVGKASIRINPDGDAETVWATRICPARAIINNIPFPESGHRYNDVVLNDGAANGYRMSDGREYPVFDELEHLTQSDYQTLSIKCELPNREAYDILERMCEKAEIKVENWTTQVVMYCKKCSEGRPHEQHDHELATDSGNKRHTIAFAAVSPEALTAILESWCEETGVVYDEYLHYE